MKDIHDVLRIATLEIKQAHLRYMHYGHKCYLWYRPTIPGRDGGIIAAMEQPTKQYHLVTPEVIPLGIPAENYALRLLHQGTLSKLPVLATNSE